MKNAIDKVSECRFYRVPDDHLLSLIREDVPYTDTTTLSLGIAGRRGTATVVTREEIVVSCSEEAARIYELLGARADVLVASGSLASPGTPILRAEGTAYSLHSAWRVAQTVLAFSSGVATYTWRMLERASKAGRRLIIATTRKAPLGAKPIYVKGVVCGGGTVHRYGLSDSILVFENHLGFLGDNALAKAARMLREKHPERKIGVEVSSLDDALEAAEAGAEYIQLEKLTPEQAALVTRELKKRYPGLTVGLAGGISLENIDSYARTGADLIVTSAPYGAPPADITTVIRPV